MSSRLKQLTSMLFFASLGFCFAFAWHQLYIVGMAFTILAIQNIILLLMIFKIEEMDDRYEEDHP